MFSFSDGWFGGVTVQRASEVAPFQVPFSVGPAVPLPCLGVTARSNGVGRGCVPPASRRSPAHARALLGMVVAGQGLAGRELKLLSLLCTLQP